MTEFNYLSSYCDLEVPAKEEKIDNMENRFSKPILNFIDSEHGAEDDENLLQTLHASDIQNRINQSIKEFCKFEDFQELEEQNEISNEEEKEGQQDCDSTLQCFIEGFSPHVAYCLQNNIDINSINNEFIKTLTPSKFMQSLAELRETDAVDGETQDEKDPEQHVENVATYYPHSMLVGNPEEFVSSPSILENYLEDNSNDSDKPQTANPNQNLIQEEKYEEEIIATSYEDIWQNLIPNNALPSVTMSTYEDMLNLQREIFQLYSKSGEQMILPIYFQPFAISTQSREQDEVVNDNDVKGKSKRKRSLDENLEDGMKKRNGENTRVVESPEDSTDDKDVLRRCKQVCFESEKHISDQISPSVHNDSMKYLEEAAMKLLLSSLTEKRVKSRTYQRRCPKDPADTQFTCKYCGKSFSRLFILQTHERVHSGDRPFKCYICGKAFRQSGTKLNHMRAVHAKVKPYQCDFCPKSFGHKSSLVVHRRIHTKEKPYQCDKCGRRFTDRATLNKHGHIHSQEKKYKCEICGRCLTQHSNLQRHIKTIHIARGHVKATYLDKK